MTLGRPSKYRPVYCNELISHLSEGASIASFAAEIGVARSTINQWAEDYPDFSEALQIAKAKCSAWWERRLRDQAVNGKGSTVATIFGLKNMAAEDWRDKQEIDLSSRDGSMSPKGLGDFYGASGEDGDES